jgi:O-antigen/teichoic acid export membrane protein
VLAVTVKGIVLASIGSVSLATIAPKTDRKEISSAIDRLLNVVIPVGTAALGLLGLLGVPAMLLLYSRAFTSSAMFFPYVLSADLLLVFVWVIGAPLLAKGDRVLWLLLDLFHAAARWGLALLLMRRLGSYAVVVGYLIAVAVHVSLNLAIYRFRYRLQLSPKHVIRVLFGLALVGLLSLAGARPTASLLATFAAAMSWLAFILYHARQGGLLLAVQRRLQRR